MILKLLFSVYKLTGKNAFPTSSTRTAADTCFENNMHIYPNFLSLKNEEIVFQHCFNLHSFD